MDNLGQAVLIMILGMGGVYLFLTVQAFITVLLTRLAPADEVATSTQEAWPVSTADPRQVAAQAPMPSSTPALAAATSHGSTVAIIQAAIAAYESDQGVRKS